MQSRVACQSGGLSVAPERKDVPANELRHVAFNREVGALEIGLKDSKGNLLLSQAVKLTPGRRYRATANCNLIFRCSCPGR